MQMRLVFSALSFLVNYVEKIASVYTFGVCKLPRLTDDDFRSKCSPFSQKSLSFVCDIWNSLTLTEVENFRRIIDGRFGFCQCEKIDHDNNDDINNVHCFNETIIGSDSGSSSTHFVPVDDVGTIVASHQNNKNESSKSASSPLLNSNGSPLFTLSIVFISLNDRLTADVSNRNPDAYKDVRNNNCEPNNKLLPSSVNYDYSMSTEQYRTHFLDFHRRVLRSRWKTKTCVTDIIIFAFDDSGEKRGQILNEDNLTNAIEELKRTVQIEMSPKAKKAFGDHQLNDLIEKINREHFERSPADKIKQLLEKLKQLNVLDTEHHDHGIPRWAVITFVVCICVSILAAVVGNFVTDDSARKRKSSSMTGKNSRKWRAGFSGGMWAV